MTKISQLVDNPYSIKTNTVETKKSNVFSRNDDGTFAMEFKYKKHVYFGSSSSADTRNLSNFSDCEVKGNMFIRGSNGEFESEEFVFPSSEHLWWSHFMQRRCDISRLAIGGDLSTIETGLTLLYQGMEPKKLSGKIKYWKSRSSVGIVAKVLANRDKKKNRRKRAEDIGIQMSIHPLKEYGTQGSSETLVKIWRKILDEKFSTNIIHRNILMGTRDKFLVEYCRMHEEKQFWAGKVKNNVLYGRNFMGLCLMATRKSFVYGTFHRTNDKIQ